jgi:hypothetical protein
MMSVNGYLLCTDIKNSKLLIQTVVAMILQKKMLMLLIMMTRSKINRTVMN